MKFKLWKPPGEKPGYVFHIKGRTDVIKVHITKTAGTSLSRALDFHRPNHELGIKKHYFAREIIDIVGEESWLKAFRFSFVRNPWDRMCSLFRFKKSVGKITDHEEFDSFKLWLKRNLQNSVNDPYDKIRPQTEWLKDFKGQIDYNFIGRFEKIEEDTKKLSTLLGIAIELPVVNKMYPTIHYSKMYDEETIALIKNYYESDIHAFNYSFESKN